jgi:hypothetical protein
MLVIISPLKEVNVSPVIDKTTLIVVVIVGVIVGVRDMVGVIVGVGVGVGE